jgi:acetolactate synthase I/II/III large subunit
MQLTGAAILIHLLERQGVRIIAGIPGGALLPLYEALARSVHLRHILARHEQAAGFIAQGIARITGKAGVCFATSGPGVTNMVTALADAKLDSVPLVCIAGQVPTHLIGTDAFQEVPTIDMVRPITKACFFVRNAQELAHVIPRAFAIAEGGRPGPVLIDVPKDVQQQRCAFDEHISGSSHEPSVQSVDERFLSRDFETAAALINQSQRPILYVGGGVVKSRAQQLVRDFVARANVPATTTLMAMGALPTNHALALGMLGMHAARYTNLAIHECDLLIACGARFDDRATGDPTQFAPGAKVIHIDIDAREFGKIRQPTVRIHADAGSALTALLQRVQFQDRTDWLQRIAHLRQANPLYMPESSDVCSPYGIIKAVAQIAADDCIVTTDVGQHQMWVAQAFPFQRCDRWLTSGGLGTMGFGLPAAIGAALAAPDATTICFTGDGSLLMNVQELATLAELQLNVKIIVLDNAALGLVRQQQELFYSQRLIASQFARPTNFASVAEAFGITGIDLARSSDPYASLRAAFDTAGPTLIRVPINPEHHVLPMVPPGKSNIEALDHSQERVHAS